MKYGIVSNGGSGALIVSKEPISSQTVINVGLNDKSEVLKLQELLNDFVRKNYPEERKHSAALSLEKEFRKLRHLAFDTGFDAGYECGLKEAKELDD